VSPEENVRKSRYRLTGEGREAIQHIRVAAARHGIPSGIHVFTPEAVSQRIQEGFRFIALGTDARFMTGAAKAALARVR
jgi:4-hydroxy-2-oxoheptanedioate aldolase